MQVEEIIKVIPTLTHEEQQRVIDAINASRAIGGRGGSRTKGKATPRREDLEPRVSLILMAICDDLKKKGMDNTSPTMAMQMADFPAFASRALVAGGAITDLKLNTAQNRHLAAIFARLLREDLVNMGLAVNVRLMMKHTHRMQGCFSRAFPGYFESGFVHLVVGRQEMDNSEHG